MFFKTYWLLWQNARNLKYIKGFNTKMARKLADSKLKTKEFLRAKWVAVPETLAILKKHSEITDSLVANFEAPFVIKPNNWFGWKGIIVIDTIDSSWNFLANTWEIYTPEKIKTHLLNVLDGFFSLSGSRDRVIIEKKIEIAKEVQILGTFGLPDIRIICFNMVPVIAMLRVPTEESDWKANIHWGACAAWIDIGTWKLTYITQHSNIIKSVPWIWDIRWLVIPEWDKMLEIAVTVQKETSIWYLWCDIVMDDRDGPLLLEMNIRPGLEVQIANRARLKDRLERVEGVYINSVEKWVRLGRDLFSWDIEEKIRNLSGKKVVWAREYITLSLNEKKYKYLAETRSGRNFSILDKDFVENVLKVDVETLKKWKILLDVDILWDARKINFVVKDMWSVNIVLWINALKWFLIDPFKYKKWQLPITQNIEFEKTTNIAVKKNYESQLKKIDKKIISIDRKLLILKHITPLNVAKEKEKFIESSGEYIPQFKYTPLTLDLDLFEKEIKALEIPDIPLSGIYIRKKEEVLHKIKFLRAFSESDVKAQTKYSKKIFGQPDKDNLEYCEEVLDSKPALKLEEEFLGFNEILAYVKKFNHIYGINIKLKRSNKTARFVMKWSTLYFRDGSTVWKKEMRSIVAHEIEGHYLRKFNWKKMDYSLFGHGSAKYLEIDEWIAIYNQNRFLNTFDKKYYGIFEQYYLTDFALNNSYKKLVDEVMDICHYDLERAFNKLMRLKRWFSSFWDEWIFVKDCVYLNGLLKVESFVHNWWDLKELYLWKITIEDLEELKEWYFMKLNFNNGKIPFFL